MQTPHLADIGKDGKDTLAAVASGSRRPFILDTFANTLVHSLNRTSPSAFPVKSCDPVSLIIASALSQELGSHG